MFLYGDFFCSYGYLTNTKVKFILVTTDLDVKDADVKNVSICSEYCNFPKKQFLRKLEHDIDFSQQFFINPTMF